MTNIEKEILLNQQIMMQGLRRILDSVNYHVINKELSKRIMETEKILTNAS